MKAILVIEDESDLVGLRALATERWQDLAGNEGTDASLLYSLIQWMAGTETGSKLQRDADAESALTVVQSVTALYENGEDTTHIIGPVVIDMARHRVFVSGSEVALTTLEFKLLVHLAQKAGRVQSRDQLMTSVWSYNYHESTRAVDAHIQRLRLKLGSASSLIQTVRGFGYKMEPLSCDNRSGNCQRALAA